MRHWASGELVESCLVESWAKSEKNVSKMRDNFSSNGDKSHAARHQNTPAFLVTPRSHTLLTYEGCQLSTGVKLTTRLSGCTHELVRLSGPQPGYYCPLGWTIMDAVLELASPVPRRQRRLVLTARSRWTVSPTDALTSGSVIGYRCAMQTPSAKQLSQRGAHRKRFN